MNMAMNIAIAVIARSGSDEATFLSNFVDGKRRGAKREIASLRSQ
jgi:hypothetical protein